MFCTKCGKQLEDTLKFCTGCGSPIVNQIENKNLCTNCGKELQDNQSFCTACGTPVNAKNLPSINTPVVIPPQNQQNNHQQYSQQIPFQQQININIPNQQANNVSANNNIKIRHGLTSFWLWLGLIGNIFNLITIILILFLYSYLMLEHDWIFEIMILFNPLFASDVWIFILMVITIIGIIGLWKIIKKWKRSGFYIFVFFCVVNYIFILVLMPSSGFYYIVQCGVYPVLTYCILRIRNNYNNKSTWEQLE